MTETDSSLKKQAINGVTWVALEKFSIRIIQFIIGIVLARLLSPSDYGVVGMLGIFMAVASTFTDSGLGSALIQKQDRTEADYSTVFCFNLFVSCLFYLLLFCMAPLIADFYHMPILIDVTRIIALALIINAISGINRSRLTILLKFREQSLISIICILVTGVLGICLAFMGFGVWALVFQDLAGAVISCILTIYISHWFPQIRFSSKSFKHLFGYGSKILGSSLINTIYGNLYTLVIGRVFNPSQVGFFNRANQYAYLPAGTLLDLALKVNFPILAKIQDDNKRLLSAYRKLMSIPLFILYPILIGMAVLAKPIIIVMIGDKWLPCVRMMQILCAGYLFTPLTHLNLNLLYVKGRTDLVLKLELIKKPIAFAILIGTIPFGIFWMVVGKAVYEFVAFSFNCYYTGKILDYGEMQQLKTLRPILNNAIIMGCLIAIIVYPISTPWIKLLVGIPIGITSYTLYAIFTQDSNFEELKNIAYEKVVKK